MSEQNYTFRGDSLRAWNIRNGLVGIGIGLIVTFVIATLNARIPSLRDILLNILFSMFISLSITNSVYVYECYLRPYSNKLWVFVTAYYLCNLVGMVVGTELSYLIVSVIFNQPYDLFGHLQGYRFNVIIVLVAGTATLLFRLQKITLQNKINKQELDLVTVKQLKTQAELQTLQSKINPHFLYNSLNAIASLIHTDADKAEEMTMNLSRLFRYSINSSQESMCTVRQEIEILETYLAIEKVRFGERIKFIVNVDEDLYDSKIPRFLIQPLVENAFKHGLKNMVDNGLLEVRIAKNSSRIEINVADNGTDFPETLEMGYGLQSTYEKLDLIYPGNYEIQIANRPKKEIRILLPLTN